MTNINLDTNNNSIEHGFRELKSKTPSLESPHFTAKDFSFMFSQDMPSSKNVVPDSLNSFKKKNLLIKSIQGKAPSHKFQTKLMQREK